MTIENRIYPPDFTRYPPKAEYVSYTPAPGLTYRNITNEIILHTHVQVLRDALSAMLTHMGMDEDSWNTGTFEQARTALELTKP